MFTQKDAAFCRYMVSGDRYSIHPDTAQSAGQRNYSLPCLSSLTDLRSFFGLASQLSNFTYEIANIMEPLRPL